MDWKEREKLKFTNGEYKQIPWIQDGRIIPIENHFPHISTKDGTLIAYTENEKKGILDRQTPIKPGRYLRMFYPNLSENKIRDLANEIGDRELRFAKTKDEIINVYKNGPSSCMSHQDDKYQSCIHPVAAYGDSDIQVAYIKSGDRIVARSLVWPEKKAYLRPYGDSIRIERELKALGYKRRPTLAGAKLSAIFDEHKGKVVGPYIDGSKHIRFKNNELFICLSNHKDATYAGNTEGFFDLRFCSNCYSLRKTFSFGDKTVYDKFDEQKIYCASCAEDISFKCEGLGVYYLKTVTKCYNITTYERYNPFNFKNVQVSGRYLSNRTYFCRYLGVFYNSTDSCWIKNANGKLERVSSGFIKLAEPKSKVSMDRLYTETMGFEYSEETDSSIRRYGISYWSPVDKKIFELFPKVEKPDLEKILGDECGYDWYSGDSVPVESQERIDLTLKTMYPNQIEILSNNNVHFSL